MATNITKTSHFTAGAGNPISFSQIRTEFGGGSTDIKASKYLKNDDANVDWNDDNTITTLVPDAVENASVSTGNNWRVDSLRDTISAYLVTQSGDDNQLSYSDNNTSVWNNNLSRNIKKVFDITGNVYSDNANTAALQFSGNLYNLEIEIDQNGAIYGQGGEVNQNGGDALYVNNTYTNREVEVRSYGKIWSGGGGGSSGNRGNSGSSLSCYNIGYYTTNGSCVNTANLNSVYRYAMNPNGVRSRCRGGGWRRGQGWNAYNMSGYHCGNGNTSYCAGRDNFNAGAGQGGNGGGGGKGRGWSNRNIALTVAPHKANNGNPGNTTNCTVNGNSSTGNRGNAGNPGGDFGQPSTKSAGKAVLKRNTRISYYTDNTLKGPISNI